MDNWFSEEFAHNFSLLAFLSLFSMLGPYAQTGRHRKLVMTTWIVLIAFGAACLAAAAVARLVGQPGYVAGPLTLSGFIVTVVFSGLYRTLVRAYQEAELRRMSARDIS
jgi:hypothetical protein